MNLKSGTIEGFDTFSQFESLKEFNRHMEMWLLDHKKDFSKGELIGLKKLVRFSAKIPGVCNAKIGTILKAINQECKENILSRSTFKRMILKGKNMGIFTVYETERKNGSQSSNLYVFNRYPSNEPPKQETMNRPKETSNLLKTEKEQKINKRKEVPIHLDHTYVSNRVPQAFVEIVKCFFPEAKVIEEYWRMAQITAYGYELHHETDLMVNLAIQSFKQLIRKLKLTKAVKNPIAYYSGILKEKYFQYYEERLNEQHKRGLIQAKAICFEFNGDILEYDWLNQ
ncbi:hypothetical protein L1999_14120 [Neobacillus drentensis]|uniref:hypothetical protein n=1 Tax=Neobacillus drentensis TaxID=220684 RepID=UPI001F27A9D9|nr:hypothetical protein [Neobacillus drentensis]ULT59586.1 hypothetical protein L1999_14120 [Neobacillus drentensis]